MRRTDSFVFGVVLLLFARLLCAEPLTIYTVNYPLQYFAQRIAGDHAQVIFPAPADVDPAFWTPDRETIGDYQRADLILLNGASYAAWVKKASLPREHQLDTSSAYRHDLITVKDADARKDGRAGGGRYDGVAFTTWLDMSQAVQQAEAITAALSRKQPEYSTDFENNMEALRKDLMGLDLDIQRVLAMKDSLILFASPPVYQYFARRYQVHIEDWAWAPDEVPDDGQWEKMRFAQEDFPAVWMLWAKQPLPEVVKKLDGLGIGVVVFDPCANRPEQGDFISVLQRNIANLKQAYAD